MAETPFSSESGAPSGGTAPEAGSQEIPAAPAAPDVAGGSETTVEATPSQPPAAPEVGSWGGVAPQTPAVPAWPPTAADATGLGATEAGATAGGPAAGAGAAPGQGAATQPASDAGDNAAPAAASAVAASAPAEPAAEATPAAQPAAEPPGVAATIEVPALEGEESGAGGEWDLLVERVTSWWNSGELGRQWQRIRGPLKGVAILVAVLLALRVYATVVSTIDAIPLVSGLLELTGLIVVLHFSVTRLLRSGDRQQVLAQWQQRWQEFLGRD